MPEKIEIFKLEIDLDAAVQAASDLKFESDELKESLATLKKAGDTSSTTYTKLKGQLDNVNKEYRVSQKQVQQITSLQGKNIETVKDARTALSLVGVEWAKSAKLYGVNSKEVQDLSKKKLDLTNRLKELEAATGDTSRNVGNYTKSILEAAGSNTIFNKAIAIGNQIMSLGKPIVKALKLEINSISTSYKTATTNTQLFNAAQKRAAIATGLMNAALKIFKLALIATGIGAFIFLLGSLIAFFTKTQKGIDFVNQALAALGAAFDVVIDRLSAFGGAIVKIFSGEIKSGLSDLTSAFSGMGDEIQREIDLAIKLEKVLQDVAKAEVNLDIRRAAANSRLKELNKIAEDVTRTEADRLEATQEFARIEEGLVASEVSNQEKRVAAMLGFAEVTDEVRATIQKIGQEGVSLDALGLSNSTLNDAKEFRDEITKLFTLQTTSFELQTTNQNKLNIIQDTIRRKRIADAKLAQDLSKKAVDAAIKENETLLKLFVEQNKGKVTSLQKGLSDLEIILTEELAIIQQKFDAEKLTREEFELAQLVAKNKFLEEETKLIIEFAGKERDAIRAKHQSRIDENSLLTDALVNEEQRRLDLIAEKQKEYEAKRLEEGIITQQQYNEAIRLVDEENRAAKDELDLQLKEQKAEADAIDFENQQALRLERDGLIFEAELAQLERSRLAEVAHAKKVGADTTKIEQRYANLSKKIKQDQDDFKVGVAADTFGNLATILGKESKAGKAAAVAQATITTYQSAVNSYNSLSSIPVVGPVLGAIAAAAAIAAGIANVKKITSTKADVPKGAKGLTMRGRSHVQGGEGLFDRRGNQLAEIESGENLYVVNRRASNLINSLSTVNQATGGIPLSKSTKYGVSGGLIERNIVNSVQQNQKQSNDIDIVLLAEMVGEKVGEANLNLPAPQVAVTDINEGQSNLAEVVDAASQ